MLVHESAMIKEGTYTSYFGMLSEESQDARNKNLRNYREHRTRKF